MVPRALGRAAADGSVDAGLMAVADYFALDGTFELTVPPMGIAVRDHVRSVVLLARRHPRHLDGRRIGITGESSTSRRLLELLAVARWGVAPEWVPEEELDADPHESVDGVLLIGDKGKLFAPGDYCEKGFKILGGPSAPEVEFEQSPGHFEEFARAIKGGPQARSNFAEYSGPLTETILLGNLAVWAAPEAGSSGKKIEWDAKNLKPTNAPEVEVVVKPTYREGYTL